MEPMNTSTRESEEVRRLAEEYRRAGYKVLVEPPDAELPGFLAGKRPDLVAQSDTGHVVVEVKGHEKRVDHERWSDIARAVEAQPGWHFRLVLLGESGGRSFDYASTTPEVIRARLQSVGRLLAAGETEGALLLAWSAFEAAARRRLLDEGARVGGLNSRALIKSLVHHGVVAQDDLLRLIPLADQRDAVAHGVRAPNVGDVRDANVAALAQVTESLLSPP